jgi:hypothetical protein
MAGTELDLSGLTLGATYQGTLSSVANECDVLSGAMPVGTRYLAIYCDEAARLGHGDTHPSKTTSSTLVDGDAHDPIPADTWMHVKYSGGTRLISSATTSAVYRIKPLRYKP